MVFHGDQDLLYPLTGAGSFAPPYLKIMNKVEPGLLAGPD